MPTQILMPALSPTMEEGTLAKWLVKEGDSVASGDLIAEIETDKATMEVEAVEEGTVGKILVDEGARGVKVNAPIAVLLADGESADDIGDVPAPPAAPPAAPTQVAIAAPDGARIFSSPLARRIAAQGGIELSVVTGSGPRGRIVKADVAAVIASGGAATPKTTAATVAPAPVSDDAVLKLFEPGSYELVPHDGMRKTIARRLTEAKRTIPHFYLGLDCVLDELLRVRKKINDRAPADADGKPSYKISVNDFVIKALAAALHQVPDANVSWTDEAMVHHTHADVGVAVSIPGGLITPIVRKAETKGLATISSEMKDMASRARNRKLLPEEYQGGSSAVSNLGMFGIKDFSAVINPPHATILAVGAGEQRAVIRDGAVQVATVMTVTLSTDHRCVDGALGAQLLDAFKGFIEEPMGLML